MPLRGDVGLTRKHYYGEVLPEQVNKTSERPPHVAHVMKTRRVFPCCCRVSSGVGGAQTCPLSPPPPAWGAAAPYPVPVETKASLGPAGQQDGLRLPGEAAAGLGGARARPEGASPA